MYRSTFGEPLLFEVRFGIEKGIILPGLLREKIALVLLLDGFLVIFGGVGFEEQLSVAFKKGMKRAEKMQLAHLATTGVLLLRPGIRTEKMNATKAIFRK